MFLKIPRWIAIAFLSLGVILFVFYIWELFSNGYINPTSKFSLTTAENISPFVSSFIAVFFTLAATLLIFENLNNQTRNIKIQNDNNAQSDLFTQKAQFENVFFNLISLYYQILTLIDTEIDLSYRGKPIQTSHEKGKNFFDDIAANITYDFDKATIKTEDELIKIYNMYFTIYSSEMGHYFRNLFHIINYVRKNPFFEKIKNDETFFQKYDYIKILRAQLSNAEIVCLALNGITEQGKEFKPFIEEYFLLKNINFEINLRQDYNKKVGESVATILITHYPHIESIYKTQCDLKYIETEKKKKEK